MSIKDFQLKKFLGKGSYGSVYMALRASDGKTYAIKKVDTRRMNIKERQEAVNEIRVLASVGGPYNIRFLEAFVDADILYIVTEFAGNGDMFGWLKARKGRGMLKEATVWSFLIQMCHGLQSLHEKNILHRDLKSANVFMMSEKHIKLGDFGVAKVLKTADALARTQVGTPYYVAPEVWKNKPYNNKCDVWSLGCLLYEMLTFRPPFDSNSMDGLARKVLRGKYEPISNAYSQDMRAILAKILVVEQKSRPSVEEILADPIVQRHMDTLPMLDAEQPPLGEDVDIMGTIHVPRKFNDVKQNLPPSRYETPLNTNRPPQHQGALPGAVSAVATHHSPPLQAQPHRPGAPDVLKAPGQAPRAPPVSSVRTNDVTDQAHHARNAADAAFGGVARDAPPSKARPEHPRGAIVAQEALQRRQAARQAQVRDPSQKLPSVIRNIPPETDQASQNPYNYRRRAPEPVKLPYLPQQQHRQGPYPPSSNQLRVVRHAQGGRTNVSVYPSQAVPSASRQRYSQDNRLPEYNPITHERTPSYVPSQQRYVPSAAHGAWR